MCCFLKYGFYEPMLFIMVFLLVYFVLTALMATILPKDPLVCLKNANTPRMDTCRDFWVYLNAWESSK